MTRETEIKVILIGLGGATWKVILPLIEKGLLPNLNKLMNAGMWGELYVPLADLPSLTTIVTGVKEEEHGVFEYCERLIGKYSAPLVPSYIRKTNALWNILANYNKTVGVINWWATCPAENVKGFVISNAFFASQTYGKKNPFFFSGYPLIYPRNLFRRLKKQIPLDSEVEQELISILGYKPEKEFIWFPPYKRFNANIDYLSEEFKEKCILSALRGFLKEDISVFKIGKYMLKRQIPDVFLVFFWGLDIIQHCFWEFYEPDASGCNFETTEEEIKKFSEVIPRYYQLIDRMIGEILAQYKNEENLIVAIVSDHGFQGQPIWKYRRQFNLNFIFEKLGWLEYKDDGNIVWSKTKIYDFLHDRLGHPDRKVYINLKGRDPKGFIKPGVEYEEFLNTVKQKLENLKTICGRKIFNKIERVKTYDSSSQQIQPPDLLIEFNQSIPFDPNIKCEIDKKVYSIKEFMIPWPRTGTHDNNGIVILSGRSIGRGRIEGATVYDITPTILNLMNIPMRKEMCGRVLMNEFKESLK